jgi:hypothetical protein
MAKPRIEGVGGLPEKVVLRPWEGHEGKGGHECQEGMVRSESYESWIEVSMPGPTEIDFTWTLSEAGLYRLGNGATWCAWPLYHLRERERVPFSWRLQGPAQPEIRRVRLCLTVTDSWNGRHCARRRPAIAVELAPRRRWLWPAWLRHPS